MRLLHVVAGSDITPLGTSPALGAEAPRSAARPGAGSVALRRGPSQDSEFKVLTPRSGSARRTP